MIKLNKKSQMFGIVLLFVIFLILIIMLLRLAILTKNNGG